MIFFDDEELEARPLRERANEKKVGFLQYISNLCVARDYWHRQK
jgi:hypothetical protein